MSVCDVLDPDVLCFLCLQPAVDYHRLKMTGRRRLTQAGYRLYGLCYNEGLLYVVEGRNLEVGPHGRVNPHSVNLTVYNVQSDCGHITRLDTLILLFEGYYPESSPSLCPRVECQSRRVFVPCYDSGVTVARLDGDRLVRERTLTCVRKAISVDVMSPDIVYVGDEDSVQVVNITNDRIISTLEKPEGVLFNKPLNLAVLGDSVMVGYFPGVAELVMYRHGSPAPVRKIPPLGRDKYVISVRSDCRNNYMLTDRKTRSVFIRDSDGNLQHTVNIPHTDSDPDSDSDTYSTLEDCVVVNRQLWVGCDNGDIVIMSSQ